MKSLKTLRQILGLVLLLAPASHSSAAPPYTIASSTYLGGNTLDLPTAVAVDAQGSGYVTGLGTLEGFPGVRRIGDGGQAFVAKVNPDGTGVGYAVVVAGLLPRAIAVNAAGEVYLAGHSYYNGLPVTNAVQSEPGGAFDAVVLKLSAAGDQVLFATYLGGAGDDAALGLALGTGGEVWVSGFTDSENFPVSADALQPKKAGSIDAFLVRLSGDGKTPGYASHFGGAAGGTVGAGLAVDSLGRPVLCGRTSCEDLPLLQPAQGTNAGGSDAFVAKFDRTGRTLVFSTFLGGNFSDTAGRVALDAAGNVYVQGYTRSTDFPTRNAAQPALAGEDDLFVAKLKPDGSELVYSTFLGSSLGDNQRGWPNYVGATEVPIDVGGLAVEPGGRLLVTGATTGSDFPARQALKATQPPYWLDAFASVLESDGTLSFSTLLGGNGSERGYDAAVAPGGGFVLVGNTQFGVTSPEFPVTAGAVQLQQRTADLDGYLIRLSPSLAVPSNDNLALAAAVGADRVTLVARTDLASKEQGEPNHAGNAGGKSVWYRWQAPAAGRLIVSTEGSDFPAMVALYSGASMASLQPLASDNGTKGGGEYSEARQAVAAGQEVLIAADGRDGAGGNLVLTVALSRPVNDDFDDRLTLSGATASAQGSTIGSTGEAGDPYGRSIWWKWSPPASGYYTLSTEGSDFDTLLEVYTGNATEGFKQIGYNGNFTNQLSRLTLRGEAGVEHQILVDGQYGVSGNVTLKLAPAARPANDEFANRIRLTGRNVTVTGTDFDAVTSEEELRLQLLAGVPSGQGRLVWWEWTAPIDGALEISTTNSVTVSTGETVASRMVIFSGDAIPTDAAKVSGFYSQDYSTPASAFLTDVKEGQRYQIGLDAVEWHSPARFSLTLREIAPPKIAPGSIQINDAGRVRARVEGVAGKNYRVLSSADLKTWAKVQDFAQTNGEFEFEALAGGARQFFRVEELP